MQVRSFCLLFLLFCKFNSFGQASDTVSVSFTKSAYLVFADSSFKYDAGSEDIIVRKNGDMLVIQAQVENFIETNLFVRVKSTMYLFVIKYNESPTKSVYDYSRSISKQSSPPGVVKSDSIDDSVDSYAIGFVEEVIDTKPDSLKNVYINTCKRMLKSEDVIHNRGIIEYKLGIYLRDLVISDDRIFLEFEVENKSNIAYVVDYFQYRVVPVKRRIKGESFQVIELKPILEYCRPSRFEGKSTYNYVIVLDKFVLTENKKLVIEHWENNGQDMNIEGGRKIDFDVFYKDILNVGI